MLKLLIGPALALVTWVAGSYYGRDAEQLVHKSPEAVYSGLSNIVAGSQERPATLTREDGRKVDTMLNFAESDPGKGATIQLTFADRPGVSADVTLIPQEEGRATLMKVKLHGNYAVLHEMLAGTEHARLAYAPDWLLNITFRPVLAAVGEQIEKGEGLAGIPAFGSQADGEANLSADQQQQMSEWHQYESTQPMSDPNGDAQKYLHGN